MENHFCHVELQTTNPAKASDLYLELFGWKVEQSQPGLGYWMIKTKEGHEIGSVKRVKEIVNTEAINFVHVAEIDATIRRSAKVGGKAIMWKTPLENPEWGFIGMLESEDGFRIGLWSKE